MASNEKFRLEYDIGDVIEKVEDGGILVRECCSMHFSLLLS